MAVSPVTNVTRPMDPTDGAATKTLAQTAALDQTAYGLLLTAVDYANVDDVAATIESFLAAYTVRQYSTLSDMTSETALVDGNRYVTQGYTTAGDGLDNTYLYHSTGKSGITVDNGWYHAGPGADDYFEALDKTKHPETLTTASPTLSVLSPSLIDSSSNAVDGTLGSGQFAGQIKTIVMTDASNSSTVTVTNHETVDGEVFTFNAVDETAVFCWTGTEWVTLYSSASL